MKKDLWLRLKHYHFDHLVPAHLLDHVAAAFGGADASTKAFANKLARKLGWSAPFALRAIDEYKKFVYLGMVSDFSVTPPKVIDQVWHEHLLFSRAYRDFCRDVLGREFDHNPELVPTKEQTGVFNAQYEATLARYPEEFNVAPPAEFWGTPKFAPNGLARQPARPKAKAEARSGTSYAEDAPLHTFFDGSDGGGASHGAMPEFGGGGGFTGGGAGHSWGGHSTSTDSTDAGHGADAGSGDGGDAGGGSGCSSSCGGGGCGGS